MYKQIQDNKSLYFTEFKSSRDFIKYYNHINSIRGNGKKYQRTAAGLIVNQQSWKPAARASRQGKPAGVLYIQYHLIFYCVNNTEYG